jgi:endonuclease/exonuclease/phosphatase family metal-dependent hydrolase
VSKSFSTIFWNVWAKNQKTPARFKLLKDRLDRIIQDYQPDVLGLNEVIADSRGNSPLLAYLEEQGYHTFFVPFSPERNGQFGGSALASLNKPLDVRYHDLGPDKFAEIRGFPGHTIKLIHAKIPHGKQALNIVVNHMAHLVPRNWTTHIQHHKSFRKIIQAPELQVATIIGGDFNQFKFMPNLWRARKLYHRATGNVLRPTWRLLGKVPIIQANYDNIFWTKCGTINLQEFKVLERHPSDHTPLIAKFNIQ